MPFASISMRNTLYRETYASLQSGSPKLLFANYLRELGTLSPGIAGLHLDLVRAPQKLAALLTKELPEFHLSLGLVDGRNV
jgi:5-methyltetrahydropteroyltriglutamate--homocysteine methyltransferase